jgi:MFS family permease
MISSTRQAGAPRWSALQRWTLGVTSMAAFMAGMDGLVVTIALPTIHADLGAATSVLSWTVVAYALGFAAVVLAGVALGDRFGRRARGNGRSVRDVARMSIGLGPVHGQVGVAVRIAASAHLSDAECEANVSVGGGEAWSSAHVNLAGRTLNSCLLRNGATVACTGYTYVAPGAGIREGWLPRHLPDGIYCAVTWRMYSSGTTIKLATECVGLGVT